MNIKLKSLKVNNLTNKDLSKILRLKNTHWKTSIREQKNWFNRNIKKKDIHNLVYLDSEIIGYNCLRYISIFKRKKSKFLLFDTIVIKNKFRRFKFGSLLMLINNQIIKKNNLPAILLCEYKKIKFYKKNGWKVRNKKIINISKLNKKYLMTYNDSKSFFNKKRLTFFCNSL